MGEDPQWPLEPLHLAISYLPTPYPPLPDLFTQALFSEAERTFFKDQIVWVLSLSLPQRTQ